MSEDFESLTIAKYAKDASLTDKRADSNSLSFPLLGLFGEVGSLLTEVKKKQRDQASYLGYAANVVEELGDVLWYLAAVARRENVCLSAIAANILHKASDWAKEDALITFEALQPNDIARNGQPLPTSQFEKTLLKLAGLVGDLLSDHYAGKLEGNQPKLAGHLVSILKCTLEAADEAGVTLEAAAIKNRKKIFDRWPKERNYPVLFDETSDPDERFPRRLEIDIFEKIVRGQPYVFQRCKGLFIGDRLTDNSVEPDDYRFHDVFHLANMAVLGWSPVLRALLKLKRKSQPEIDEAQDGARAILIEEGITTWIFGQAQPLDYFKGIDRGTLPLDMLKYARQFAAGYESAKCPLWLWEDAILQGYAAFRFLKEHRRGRVKLDLVTRTLTIEELPL